MCMLAGMYAKGLNSPQRSRPSPCRCHCHTPRMAQSPQPLCELRTQKGKIWGTGPAALSQKDVCQYPCWGQQIRQVILANGQTGLRSRQRAGAERLRFKERHHAARCEDGGKRGASEQASKLGPSAFNNSSETASVPVTLTPLSQQLVWRALGSWAGLNPESSQ